MSRHNWYVWSVFQSDFQNVLSAVKCRVHKKGHRSRRIVWIWESRIDPRVSAPFGVAYSRFATTGTEIEVTRRALGVTYWGQHECFNEVYTGFARLESEGGGSVTPFSSDDADASNDPAMKFEEHQMGNGNRHSCC